MAFITNNLHNCLTLQQLVLLDSRYCKWRRTQTVKWIWQSPVKPNTCIWVILVGHRCRQSDLEVPVSPVMSAVVSEIKHYKLTLSTWESYMWTSNWQPTTWLTAAEIEHCPQIRILQIQNTIKQMPASSRFQNQIDIWNYSDKLNYYTDTNY